ncbi:hypothetical protein OU787_02890 [Kitasatospora sp. YST-16]|uniref:hypothetical protein n=1 Tax=Kitasatospora sp. YST-16 TaxID=2998080 RepID=UPI0022848032|nr:hypothetical protein [Kitasatospora sp. YST-16]WAL76629.1 hypothetical protein OU787_02890 [Kitasatospora sp. YST-16]WNW42636.1 hypothetical protein RKE32_02885 [Streptomyces sp. Li-HN-5-13]
MSIRITGADGTGLSGAGLFGTGLSGAGLFGTGLSDTGLFGTGGLGSLRGRGGRAVLRPMLSRPGRPGRRTRQARGRTAAGLPSQ